MSKNKSEENNSPVTKKEKTKKPIRTLLFILWILLVTIIMIVFMYLYPKFKNMNSLENTQSPTEEYSPLPTETPEPDPTHLPTAVPTPEITPEPVLEMRDNKDYGIINIAVFGMDNRYRKTILGGRSDVNIILTIDTKNNEIRLTSIMRDTLVYIPSKDDLNRVNTAIVYEDGPQGAINAIEQEFLIDIDHYILTSFRGMIEIIDALGGVEVTLSQNEVWNMNGLIQEMNGILRNRRDRNMVSRKGTQTLSGIQAVAYMRIRKSDGVFMRDSRQKEVLESAKNKLSNMTFAEIDNVLNTVTEWVKTDLEPLELISMTKTLYDMRNSPYMAQRVPYDGLYEAVRYKKMAVLQYEKEPTLWRMHDFIYNGIVPEEETDE